MIEGGREKPSSEELSSTQGMNESPYDLLLGIFMQDTRTYRRRSDQSTDFTNVVTSAF